MSIRTREIEAAGVTVSGYGVVPLGKDIGRRTAGRSSSPRRPGVQYLRPIPIPDALDAIDKLIEQFDVAVGIHNHGPGHRYAKIDTIAKTIKDHHPKFGVCIDTGHFLRSKEDPVHAVEAFGKRVYGVHLKDVKDAEKFTILGQGDLRTVDFLKALAKNKYSYLLAIEYEESPENPVADIKACLVEAAKAIAEVREGLSEEPVAMIPRVLEPEAMETAEEVRQYDAMDHSAVNDRFVADFLSAHGPCRGGEILDVGTGTARIPIALARADGRARILALDLSATMLEQAGSQHRHGRPVATNPLPARGRQVAPGRIR